MNRPVPNRQIAEEAAEWAIRIDNGPLAAADREALAAWLKVSPAHVDELLYAASILGGLEQVDRGRNLKIDDNLVTHAPDVIPLFRDAPAEGSTANERPKPGGIFQWSRAAIAASLAAMVIVGLALADPFRSETAETEGTMARSYTADLGEQRSITLADGSVVFLNTSSRINVRLSANERRIDLLQGEALFEVAHDASRPFRVYAAGTMAQAVGTKFNVRYTPAGVRVVVVEGKVLVDSRLDPRTLRQSAAQSAAPEKLARDQALLTAGQQAELNFDLGVPKLADADIVAAASWRMRQLSFDHAGLDEIVAEFNRYNRTPIVLADPALSRTRFSGVFDANDPNSFVAFLELSTSVEVDRSQPGSIVLKPKRP